MLPLAGWFCATLGLIVGTAHAYKYYQAHIPSGLVVPHPCKANHMWPGVGHNDRLGKGPRNPFGNDFAAEGHWWSENLCRKDSDGDGIHNGKELGDPDCTWTPGTIPSRAYNITHPGICDPYDSPKCEGKNPFLKCEFDGFYCPQIHQADVESIDLPFPETKIPNTETNYYCMTFNLPQDQDYHVIATEPIIGNVQVLHHILVYACENDNATWVSPPQACGMEANGECNSLIGLWSVGNAGFCFGDGIGFRIGASSFKRVLLEIHYNNPMKVDHYTDTSGIRLYYQPARPDVQDLRVLWTGTTLFELPPQQPKVLVRSVCKEGCTKVMVKKKAKIFAGINHMHYMGTYMNIELFRGGKKVHDISLDEYYSYDAPVAHTHDPHLDLLPGDEIRTTCAYNSMSTDKWVQYGDATSDEMCFGFVLVYPADALNFHYCLSFDTLDICELRSGKPIPTPIGECRWAEFSYFKKDYTPYWAQQLDTVCSKDGRCRPECKSFVEHLMDTEPCLHQNASAIVSWRLRDSRRSATAQAQLNACMGAILAERQHGGGGHTGGHCTWDQCSNYCPVTDHHGVYDAAPKMAAAGWITMSVMALQLLL